MTISRAGSRRAPIRIGLIGCGYWGQRHLNKASRLPGVQLTALCDVQDEILQRASRLAPGARAHARHEALLCDAVDAVVIASPASHHHPIVMDALAAGKDVLIEKPLALRTAEAQEVVEAVGKTGCIVLVGYTFLYNPAVRRLRQLLDEGAIGEVLSISSVRTHLGMVKDDVDVMWDLAPHDISIINYLLSARPTEVRADGVRSIAPTRCDVVDLTLRYPAGTVAHVHVSWIDPQKSRRLEVLGTRGKIVFDDVPRRHKLTVYDPATRPPWRPGDETVPTRARRIRHSRSEPLLREWQHFVDCIRTRKPPLTHPAAALGVVSTLEAATVSLSAGGREVSAASSSKAKPFVALGR